jgi:predicted AAA+ superfamily ATPase
MAITNHERVGKALNLLMSGLGPFIQRELENVYADKATDEMVSFIGDDHFNAGKPIEQWDASVQLKLMWNAWNAVFKRTLGHSERSLVSELRDHRNNWAHQQAFSSDEAYRVMDSVHRMLTAVSASQAEDVEKMKLELLRLKFDEQVRSEKRREAAQNIETGVSASLKPWREVITPHRDVARGDFQQAEFAADLWQVYRGEGSAEYKDPVEFFRRTFLTDSLNRMLVKSLQRLSKQGGDPVVQLQTNFGGGKTHSMLALFHLLSGIPIKELPGIDSVIKEAGIESLPIVKRVVLVGNKISPGNPVQKDKDVAVNTLWGELAWQLGGKEAYEQIRHDDERATNPGDRLRELIQQYSPCLILIDEWVAYARQLHSESDLPGGSFETHFSFAQTLTESVKAVNNALLVVSLPASDTAGSPHTTANDEEVGGQRGREALDRLRTVIGRLESSWRPATAEESFEIVKRRLFDPISDPDMFKQRDLVARSFVDFYGKHSTDFPSICREADYEKRIKAAYPIHPEVFDQLYGTWSTLLKFQRTRGVLRLMASVIHSLWQRESKDPLIMPAHIAISEGAIQTELTQYLSDNWPPIIEKDVDGPDSLPLKIDNETPNLGRYSACRRVARTIYMGSAPLKGAAHRGLDDLHIRLGCIMPGEPPAIFGDALRRLSEKATYLYHDSGSYWYDTQPTVTKMAEDRAGQLMRDPDKVSMELNRRIRQNLGQQGEFARVHALPQSGQDVSDEMEARLVVLGTEYTHSRGSADSAALKAAASILDSRGSGPRIFRNSLTFLVPDKTRLQDLDQATRKYLAWESILAEKDHLDLTPQQVRQAESQRKTADSIVAAQIPETWQWLLVPEQKTASDKISWQTLRLSGSDPLAVRASNKLRHDEQLMVRFAGTLLKMEMDRVPLWRGNHVAVRQLIEDFASYLYLSRLRDASVLIQSIQDGLKSLTWTTETFAFADSWNEAEKRYVGLKSGQEVSGLDAYSSGYLVKPDIAKIQMDQDQQKVVPGTDGDTPGQPGSTPPVTGTSEPEKADEVPRPKRFYGSVELDPERIGRDSGRIGEEIVAHLAGLVNTDIKITLEIHAKLPNDVNDFVVRTVTENCRTLKFSSFGFEEE